MSRISILRFTFFFLSILTFNTRGLNAREGSLIPDNIRVNKDHWVAGICRLAVSNLDDRFEYLSDSLPQLLKEELRDITEHNLSLEEKDFLKSSYINDQINQTRNTVDALYTRRDELLFSDNSDEQKTETYNGYSESIREKMQEEEAWYRLDADLIELEDILPVEYMDFDSCPQGPAGYPFYGEE